MRSALTPSTRPSKRSLSRAVTSRPEASTWCGSRPSSTCRSMGRKGPRSDSWLRCADGSALEQIGVVIPGMPVTTATSARDGASQPARFEDSFSLRRSGSVHSKWRLNTSYSVLVDISVPNELPPHLHDILAPTALYSLGLAGIAIALTGGFLPARRAPRSRVAEILQCE